MDLNLDINVQGETPADIISTLLNIAHQIETGELELNESDDGNPINELVGYLVTLTGQPPETVIHNSLLCYRDRCHTRPDVPPLH